MTLKVVDGKTKINQDLLEAIQTLQEVQPEEFIFVYIDPSDGRLQLTVNPARKTRLRDQLGMLEYAKLMIGVESII